MSKTATKPIPNHPYHSKSDAQLRYIAKDAGEAARAMRGVNEEAEGKYADQVCDACSILGWRQQRDAFLSIRQGRLLAAAA